MQTGYTLSRDQIFDVENNASIAVKDACGATNLISGQDPNCQDEVYWTSALGGTLTYDKRNHPRNPTSGYYLQLASDFAGLGGDVNYVRVQGEGRAYYPITEKITLIGRVVGGQIEGWGGDDVRLLDLFFKGGETVRGFERAGYGPRDLVTGDALGGQTFWGATAELRFPIPLVPDDLGISGAVFADAGSLFNASQSMKDLSATNPTSTFDLVDDSALRSSVGVSLLWNSPVGPLRVDYAEPLSKESYDKEQKFRFGASTKF